MGIKSEKIRQYFPDFGQEEKYFPRTTQHPATLTNHYRARGWVSWYTSRNKVAVTLVYIWVVVTFT